MSKFNLANKYDSSSGIGSSDPEMSSMHHNCKRYFQRIFIKRDYINNVGNLICFPLMDNNQILIVGGLNIGLLAGKSHIYNTEKMTVNYHGNLEMPIPDVSKFFYKFHDSKVYVVGQSRIQEFDLKTNEWSIKSFGYQQISKSWLNISNDGGESSIEERKNNGFQSDNNYR